MDADMAAELTDHLFQQDDEKFGLDLVQYIEVARRLKTEQTV